ncbi:hypothetical protein HDU84_009005 [Entophlyctis sp. JEL0112]|nr:hypothetical protein HDU84_009005 [Entophlyctis sp. JEL0112]
MFAHAAPAAGPLNGVSPAKTKLLGVGDGGLPKGKSKKSSIANAEHAGHTIHAGIRVVDTEEYVLGLTKTQFTWLGHESRFHGSTLCFTGKIIAETHEVRQCDRSKSPLLGIGIEVPSLDALLKRWEWERPNEVVWEPGRTRVPGIGQYSRFRDPHNNIPIEIFTPKTIDPAEVAKEAAAAAAKAAAEAAAAAAQKAEKLNALYDTMRAAAANRVDRDYLPPAPKSGILKIPSEAAILPAADPNSSKSSAVGTTRRDRHARRVRAPREPDAADAPHAESSRRPPPPPSAIAARVVERMQRLHAMASANAGADESSGGADAGEIGGDGAATAAVVESGAVTAARAELKEKSKSARF